MFQFSNKWLKNLYYSLHLYDIISQIMYRIDVISYEILYYVFWNTDFKKNVFYALYDLLLDFIELIRSYWIKTIFYLFFIYIIYKNI